MHFKLGPVEHGKAENCWYFLQIIFRPNFMRRWIEHWKSQFHNLGGLVTNQTKHRVRREYYFAKCTCTSLMSSMQINLLLGVHPIGIKFSQIWVQLKYFTITILNSHCPKCQWESRLLIEVPSSWKSANYMPECLTISSKKIRNS